MPLPVVILHGWSDTSKSFKSLAEFLTLNGYDTVPVFLGDYVSMEDQVTLKDLGAAMIRAVDDAGLPQKPKSFHVVVHSTGGLVVREYLRQVCAGKPAASPVSNICMLAPANFGSPLAKLGNSLIGRLTKGWNWDYPMQTGEKVLNALELASPYSWELAMADLFDPEFPIFAPKNVRVSVLVGSNAYDSVLRSSLHENGSDGTVRVSTANLNTHHLHLDWTDPDDLKLKRVDRNCPDLALAVFDRDHTTIHEPDPQGGWPETVLRSLNVTPAGYASHVDKCEEITRATFEAGRAGKHPERFHEFQHVVFKVRDQFDAPVLDYMVEFYQSNDRKDVVFQKFHGEIIEKVTTNKNDPSFRSFLFDTTDLVNYLNNVNPDAEIAMSISAAPLSKLVRYDYPKDGNPKAGIVVFSKKVRQFLLPNRPLLIEVILRRETDPKVFQLKKAK
jgi:pimeloyl-ACP methyl ester carboxylesterase